MTDKCSTDKALELVCIKAYQCVIIEGGDTALISAAIEKCRELKVNPTGEFKTLREDI